MQLALFDLDHTLLAGDSDVEWAEMLEDLGLIERGKIRGFLADYQAGTLDTQAFYAYQVGSLARVEPVALRELRQTCFHTRWRPLLDPGAKDLVAGHRTRGHECVLITATNRFLVEPIAKELGFEHLVATEPQAVDGRFTGRIVAPPCLGPGKIVHLERWLEARAMTWGGVKESWFYSDSHNDLPLLSRVTHALAVGPDARLLEVARQRGWQVLPPPSPGQTRAGGKTQAE